MSIYAVSLRRFFYLNSIGNVKPCTTPISIISRAMPLAYNDKSTSEINWRESINSSGSSEKYSIAKHL